jgi:hypothetical protein
MLQILTKHLTSVSEKEIEIAIIADLTIEAAEENAEIEIEVVIETEAEKDVNVRITQLLRT